MIVNNLNIDLYKVLYLILKYIFYQKILIESLQDRKFFNYKFFVMACTILKRLKKLFITTLNTV